MIEFKEKKKKRIKKLFYLCTIYYFLFLSYVARGKSYQITGSQLFVHKKILKNYKIKKINIFFKNGKEKNKRIAKKRYKKVFY